MKSAIRFGNKHMHTNSRFSHRLLRNPVISQVLTSLMASTFHIRHAIADDVVGFPLFNGVPTRHIHYSTAGYHLAANY